MFSWTALGLAAVVEQNMNGTVDLNIIVHYYRVFVFRNRNEVFPQVLTGIVLEYFQECNTEFQLTLWSPNLTDLNPTEHTSCAIQR